MSRTLEISSVSKNFGTLVALADVCLDVSAGETLALLGHNGAGKTTLFKILLGFLAPDRGSALIAGHAAGSRAARRSVSYLPESVAFPHTLTGKEIVELYATLKDAETGEAMVALERVGLSDAAHRRCGTYSKGMRQRLGLAQAIVGNPEILLLDEPTSGLDPVSRVQFYELVAQLADDGATIVLSSHGLSELEAKIGRIAILRNGRLVADGSMNELQTRADLPIRIRVKVQPEDSESLHKSVGGRRVNGSSIELTCTLGEKIQRIREIHQVEVEIHDLEIAPPSLDEVYRYFSTAAPGKEIIQ